jgi:hypothetical protein
MTCFGPAEITFSVGDNTLASPSRPPFNGAEERVALLEDEIEPQQLRDAWVRSVPAVSVKRWK